MLPQDQQDPQQNDNQDAAIVASIVDIGTRRAVFAQMYAQHQSERFVTTLIAIDTAIRYALSGDSLTGLNRRKLNAALASVQAALTDIYLGYTDSLQADVLQFAANEAEFTGKTLAQVTGDSANTPSDDDVQAAVKRNPLSLAGATGALLPAYIAKWAASEVDAVVGSIRLGAFTGKNNAEILQAIRGTSALNYKDGLLSKAGDRAKSVANTAVVHASSVARQETFAVNPQIATEYRWVSILDSRTCVVCGSLSERVFLIGKGPLPQIHNNCRCNVVPILPDDTGADNRNYYSWLKDQPAEFIDLALGPTRGKLLRDGGLSAARFSALLLDRNFKALSLEEIKRLDPIAWVRAGLR